MRSRCGLGVAVVVTLAFAACSGTASRASQSSYTPPALRVFAAQGISFNFPASWSAGRLECGVSTPQVPSGSLVALSNKPFESLVGPNCHPFRELTPHGIVVEWWWRPVSYDTASVLTPPTSSLFINGHAVTEKTLPASACYVISDVALATVLDGGTAVYGFNACLRGPDLKTSEAQVQAMLASVKVTGLQPSAGASPTTSTGQPTEASTPRASEAVVRGTVGGLPPCATFHSDGAYGPDTAHPQRAPLQAVASFGSRTRWAMCGASGVFSGDLLNLRSVDGGATWTVSDTGLVFSPHHAGDELKVTFSTPANGAIHVHSCVGQSDVEYTTTDGGRTWHT